MIVNKIIRKIMETKDVKLTVLASRLGVNKSTMCERLTQENMSTDRVIEMLRVMDYKIVVMPNECRLPNGAYEIEHSPAKPKEKKVESNTSDKE